MQLVHTVVTPLLPGLVIARSKELKQSVRSTLVLSFQLLPFRPERRNSPGPGNKYVLIMYDTCVTTVLFIKTVREYIMPLYST